MPPRACLFDATMALSSTTSFAIQRDEAYMKEYLRYTPASGSSVPFWSVDAATSFAAWKLLTAISTKNAPHSYYASDLTTDRGSRFLGNAL